MINRRGFIKMLAAGTVVAASGVGAAVARQASAETLSLPVRGAALIGDRLYLLRGEPGEQFQLIRHPFVVDEPLDTGEDLGLRVRSDGPAVIAPSSDGLLWVLTTRRVDRTIGTFSYELDDATAASLAPGWDAPTAGVGDLVESFSTVVLNLVASDAATAGGAVTVELVRELGRDEAAFLEPVGVFSRDGRSYLAVTSSGRYGTEANLADEVLAFPLPETTTDEEVLATSAELVLGDLGHGVGRIAVVGADTGAQDLVISGDRDLDVDLSRVRSDLSYRTMAAAADGSGGSAGDATRPRAGALLRHDRTPIAGVDGYVLTAVTDELLIVESV